VAINNPGLPPTVIHDGVGVAKRIELTDEFEDMGAQLIKEAALQTSVKAGDGTTTSTVLAQAIINKSIEIITAGANPMILKSEMDNMAQKLAFMIKELSEPIKTLEEKTQVAIISAANKEIGKLVARVIHKVGSDGLITIEESKTLDTFVEYKQGVEFDRGYYSPYFVTKPETGEVSIDEPYILLTDIKINHDHQIVPFLENMIKEGIRNLVVVGEVQEQALATLVLNKLKGNLHTVAVQAPSYGERQIHELEDIAVLTGGAVVSMESGRTLDSVTKEELGRADKFVCDSENSKIIGGKGDSGVIKNRVVQLKKALEYTKSPYEKEVKKGRIARLSGTAAVIYVGAASDPELSDRKERVDDAVHATRAAVEEGIVAGGEITLLYMAGLDIWDDTTGSNILKEAFKTPFKRLVENAGYDYAEVLGKITPFKYPFGIDVMDGKKKDLIKAGIIDPVKVTRLSLENAISVATMAMTTDVLISEPYERREK
jgi:chaperonin GroEL